MPPDHFADGKLIAVDWGTSRLRMWLLDDAGRAIAGESSDEGIARTGTGHEATFERLAANWPRVPAIMAGMVGSRQGWREAPYVPCPADAPAISAGMMRFETATGRPVAIVPGVAVTIGGADVMRGEETQLLGLLDSQRDFSGTAILPGTHSKWARLDNNRIVDFQSFMSGELFELLARKSFLRHSVAEDAGDLAALPAFEAAIRQTVIEGLPFLSALFPIRARQLLSNTQPDDNLAYLSGLVIGGEIAAARAGGRLPDGERVSIVGARSLARAYRDALAISGHDSETLDGNELVLAGLAGIARVAGMLAEAKP